MSNLSKGRKVAAGGKFSVVPTSPFSLAFGSFSSMVVLPSPPLFLSHSFSYQVCQIQIITYPPAQSTHQECSHSLSLGFMQLAFILCFAFVVYYHCIYCLYN
jgi:hypothetical protein